MTPPVLKAQAMNPQLTNPLAGEMAAVLASYHTESGRTLLGLVDESPVLLIFLRHFGCSFCRQTLDDVSQIRAQIEGRGVRPVFVHLGTPERAKPYFDYYHLPDIERVSDPEASLYGSPVFQVRRKNVFTQFLIPGVWKAWLLGAVGKHGIGMIQEDASQMPAVFYLSERAIAREYRYKTIADRPDYLKLIG
jgi:peroxiredoxin